MKKRATTTALVSTRSPGRLPQPERLRALSQSLALLDAILEPEWELRYFSFDPAWDEGEQLASMRNGEGDFYFIWFAPAGVVIRGFDHESPMSPARRPDGKPWPGLFAGYPDSLRAALTEPAFRTDEITFCLWREAGDDAWHTGEVDAPEGEDPDGSARQLAMLDDDPASFVRYAREYHEVELDVDLVRRIYAHEPLTGDMVRALNPDADVKQALESARAMGFEVRKLGGRGKARAAEAQAATPAAAPAEGELWTAEERKPGIGAAEFRVAVMGKKVKMVVNGKAIAEGEGDGLYDELFDLVKARLQGGQAKQKK